MSLDYRPFQEKTLVICITGGIAAYKAADYARKLTTLGANVIPVMTENACRFITPLTVTTLTGNKVHTDIFDQTEPISHISLARQADLMLTLPATANFLAKVACGIADDIVSTLALANAKPMLIFPAMNPVMYAQPVVQRNIRLLREMGHIVVEPAHGETACKETGTGRLPEFDVVREYALNALCTQDLHGKKVLISAGPTQETIDPVRFISNRSSGLMGYMLAQVAWRRGAQVKLVSGPSKLPAPVGVERFNVQSACEMEDALSTLQNWADIIFMSAAVADYRPKKVSLQKIKKGVDETTLELVKNDDILSKLTASRRAGQTIIGFCAETNELAANALSKFQKKRVDMLVANDISQPDAGFDVQTNRVLLITKNGVQPLPLMRKETLSERLIDVALSIQKEGV